MITEVLVNTTVSGISDVGISRLLLHEITTYIDTMHLKIIRVSISLGYHRYSFFSVSGVSGVQSGEITLHPVPRSSPIVFLQISVICLTVFLYTFINSAAGVNGVPGGKMIMCLYN